MAYERLLIRDLGSRNGLRVNGRLVDEAQLQTGDEVAIGPVIYRVHQQVEPPPAPRGAGSSTSGANPKIPPPDPRDPDGDLIPFDI
jgi:pSer/pThr/pTyr-binding forkhead associated (FHA) protein